MINKKILIRKLKNIKTTRKLVLQTLDTCSNSEEESIKKYLKYAYHCHSNTTVIEGKPYPTSYYCNTNICLNCINRKIFDKVSKNYQFVMNWENCTQIVLTVNSIKRRYLLNKTNKIHKTFSEINRKLRYYGKRRDSLRKTDIGYNIHTKKFNPHIHLLGDYNLEEAEEIINLWLKSFRGLSRKNQYAKTGYTDRAKILWYILKPQWLKIYEDKDIFHPLLVKHVLKTYRRGGKFFQKYGYFYKEEFTEKFKNIYFSKFENLKKEENLSNGYWYFDKDTGSYINSETGEIIN